MHQLDVRTYSIVNYVHNIHCMRILHSLRIYISYYYHSFFWDTTTLFLGYYHSFYGVVRNIYTHTIFIYLRGYTPYSIYYILGSLKKIAHSHFVETIYSYYFFIWKDILNTLHTIYLVPQQKKHTTYSFSINYILIFFFYLTRYTPNIRFLKKTYYILISYKLLHTLILFERIYSILCMPFIGMSLLCMLDVHE